MPNEPHILEAKGNIQRVARNLVHIIGNDATRFLCEEIQRNSDQLLMLGKKFIAFSSRLPPQQWRNKVSRAYYGAYNVARAVRLEYDGSYSTDSTDHKNIGKLPVDMTSKERFENLLPVLRDDRNLCDYDHTIGINDLNMHPNESVALSKEFLVAAEDWFQSRRTT